MSKSLKKNIEIQMIDLSNYANHILAIEDHPLFDEAVAAAKVGALRAAYVMIWLACAESLKRRFREAQKRDGAAAKIIGEVESKESDHRAVDKFVLEKARDYGFVSDSGHTILTHVYEMRCLYGHPYEEAPSKEQLAHAAAVVVEHVLSKPVKLRHGFGKQLLKSLLEEQSYLDDQSTAVIAFTKEILPRLDESIHGWLLDYYWRELERLSDDSSMAIFFRRGIWFCQTMLKEIGIDVFGNDDWHDKFGMYPKTLMRICSLSAIFKGIGKRAQDSLVGSILAESVIRSRILIHLERLNNKGSLSTRQQERFTEHLSSLKISEIRSAGLSTKTCYGKLIEAMKTFNWYVQNPAIEVVLSNGPTQAAELSEEQQINLGRNILQAGEGRAGEANIFLDKLSQDVNAWPLDVVRGIAFELFTHEINEIRLKVCHLEQVLTALSHLNSGQQNHLIAQIAASITEGSPKNLMRREDFESAIELLKAYSWTAPLVGILELKADCLTQPRRRMRDVSKSKI